MSSTTQDSTNPASDYVAPSDLLKDKVILVTGAGDGIGRAAAIAYAKHGATVILLSKTIDKLEAVYDEIEAAGYPKPAIYPMHLFGAVAQDYDELALKLEDEFGRLDGLLHNASVLGERRTLAQTSTESWEEVLQVNLTSNFLMTRSLLPLLEKSDNGSLVFTSSSVGRKGRAFWGAYAVSKAATENLMQILADETESTSNIRVNSINPGATNTAMRRIAYPGENPASNPTPEDIMPLYLWLMGKDSIGTTGQQLSAQP